MHDQMLHRFRRARYARAKRALFMAYYSGSREKVAEFLRSADAIVLMKRGWDLKR